MKFELKYPDGTKHEVELQGSVAVLGRDPSADLVLNDVRCSRKHAVVEAGPHGIAIRDTGSANGVYLNGQKVERANLRVGDEVRLGEIILLVLPEEMPGTVVMGPEDLDELAGRPPAPAPPPRPGPHTKPIATVPPVASTRPVPLRAPAPSRAAPATRPPAPAPRSEFERAELPRPSTATALALLWALSTLFYGVLAAAAFVRGRAPVPSSGLPDWRWIATGGVSALLALLSPIMAFGLRSRAAWARYAQLAVAGIGVFTCAFTAPSAAVLAYMLRPNARVHFSGKRLLRELSPQEAESASRGSGETAFTLTILGTLFLGVLAVSVLAFVFGGSVKSLLPGSVNREAAAIRRMRDLATAEDQFRAGTCGSYADLDGLLNPARAIPNYPATGPTFLPREFGAANAGGYHFELKLDEAVPSSEGCPHRSFRRFVYSADPIDALGHHFIVGPDRIVHAAEGRPATTDDPPAAK